MQSYLTHADVQADANANKQPQTIAISRNTAAGRTSLYYSELCDTAVTLSARRLVVTTFMRSLCVHEHTK